MKKLLISGSIFLLPAVALADNLSQVDGLVRAFGKIVGYLIPIAGALALVYFFWGLAKFILHADDEEERKKGRQMMIWGIVAIFIIASIWGIVGFIASNLGIDQTGGNGTIPGVNNTILR